MFDAFSILLAAILTCLYLKRNWMITFPLLNFKLRVSVFHTDSTEIEKAVDY